MNLTTDEMLNHLSYYNRFEHTNLKCISNVNWVWVCDSTYKWTGKNFSYVLHLFNDKTMDDLEVWGGGKLLAIHKCSGYAAAGRRISEIERYGKTV